MMLGKQNINSVLHMSASPPGSFSLSLLFSISFVFLFNLFLPLISSQQRSQVNIQSSDQGLFFFPFFRSFSLSLFFEIFHEITVVRERDRRD